jgi:ribosomal protein RSM22 (predicted rRNA methylase)
LERSAAHRRLKGAMRGHEDEAFATVIVSKRDGPLYRDARQAKCGDAWA